MMTAGRTLLRVSLICLIFLGLFFADSSAQVTTSSAVTGDSQDLAAVPIGITMSEAEYSWGSFPTGNDLAYLKSNNLTLIRLPIAWERAQPVLFGTLNSTYISALKTFITAAAGQQMTVILDLHDYGRYNVKWAADVTSTGVAAPGTGSGEFIIGSPSVPMAAFVDLWTKLAGAMKGTPGLGYYDIMNEPNGMGNTWPTIAQAAVTAIRAVDMNTPILVPGTQWSSAFWWPGDNGNLYTVTDPANKILFEAHLYFDTDGSGRYLQSYRTQGATPTWGVEHVQPFLNWLTQHNVKGFLGEFGIPNNDPLWLPVLDNFLTAIQAAGVSGTYWNYAFHSSSDPSWWPDTSDHMSIVTSPGFVQNNVQMPILSKHNTASSPAPPAPTGLTATVN